MKVIDLLNKIAKGEEIPEKIRIDHWCYKFEWKDYAGNYVDEHEDIDLMSALSCDKEELNYEVYSIEESQEHKIPVKLDKRNFLNNETLAQVDADLYFIIDKINEIIDYLGDKE